MAGDKYLVDQLKPHRTMRDVAAELGVSRQLVNVLEKRALTKLRLELERRGITLQDLVVADRPELARVHLLPDDADLSDQPITDLGGAR